MNHSSIHENSTISPESSKKGTDNSDDSFDDFRINSSKFQKKTTEKKR